MKCKCSLDNNYKVIGLCDIKKFNEKIRAFDDKSWAQIVLPEKLTLPSNSPDVKNITKVYINIKITSTRIIRTPSSNNPNTEGLKLTGKILLTSGSLCQKIIYIADNCSQSMHSVKFNVPFNTYIVIDENIDIDADKYCVYPCVEDVSIRIIDKRHLSKSVTLFLFAHKISGSTEPPGPPIININNKIIFYDFPRRDKKEVVRISFDNNNKQLKVTSTGNPYNSSNEGFTIWLQLKDKNGTTLKAEGEVLQNQDGTNFVNSLNNVLFEVDDLIFIDYQIAPNVVLTNFPSLGENYDMNFVGNRILRITKDGIVPTILPNVISLNSIDNKPVINIGLDTHLKILLPHPPNPPAGAVTNPRFVGMEYFKIIIRDLNLNEKYNASIQGNQTAFEITRNLTNKPFEYGDIIDLTYKEGDKIQITNNPYPTSTKYTLSGNAARFEIQQTGLRMINLPLIPSINKVPNKITIKSKTNQEVATIEFNKDTSKFIVNSTGVIPDSSSSEPYFNLILKSSISARTDLLNITLNSNENAENFKIALNDKSFDFNNNRLIISYTDKTKIEISNYPSPGQLYIPTENPSLFEITKNGLVDKSYSSKIKIYNDDNKEVATVQFLNASDALNVIIVASYTGEISTNLLTNTQKYVQFTGFDTGIPFNGVIFGTQNANDFFNGINLKRTNTGFPMRLLNKISNRIIITNYRGQNEYRIGQEPEFLAAFGDGTVEPFDLNYNKITLKNRDNTNVLFINFLKNREIFFIYSNGVINTDSDNFTFKLFNSSRTTLKLEKSINRNQNADSINTDIRERFDFDDILELSYSNGSLVEITNLPTKGDIYNPKGTSERFKLTNTGLKIIKPLNVITFKGQDNKIIATVTVNINSEILNVESTGEIANTGFGGQEYFALVLKESNGAVKKQSMVLGFDNANNFKNTLNNQKFEYGDIISLRYKRNDETIISNYLISGNDYNPFPNTDDFKITQTGLALAKNFIKNIITFKGDRDKEIAKIRFNMDSKTLDVGSTDTRANGAFGEQEYFALILKGRSGAIKEESSVKGNQGANGFMGVLNGKSFEYGDFITLRYRERNRVEVSNYPNDGQTFNPPNSTETFKITQTGLEVSPPTPTVQKLQNAFILSNTQGQEMLKIEFDVTNTKLIVTATDAINNDQSPQNTLFTFETSSISHSIKFGENARNFASIFNNARFFIGNTCSINYFSTSNNNIKVTNYPNQGEDYTPRRTPPNEIFQISRTGLVKL